MMTPQLAIWLSLLVLLTVLSIYECLHDALPDAWLSFACIAYAWALMLLATTPEHLLHGFAAGGAGFLLGVLGQAPGVFARGGPSARVGGAGTLAAAARFPGARSTAAPTSASGWSSAGPASSSWAPAGCSWSAWLAS